MAVLALSLFSLHSSAQIDLKVMCYNVLNFPNGSAGRTDTLKKVLDYYTPDILMVQELKSPNGLIFIQDALNEVSSDYYGTGTYVVQQSNPSSSNKLQQNIAFNAAKLGLAYEEVVQTNYRDVNYFKLYLKTADLDILNDTTFIHCYVTHLKSSQGATNEQLRYEMAQVMRSEINNLPADSYVLCAGDFNLYTSNEPAYQHLIQTGLNNTLVDPIDMPGYWHDFSFPNKEILTQSTRLNSLSDGAGGGLDDRFDFILQTENLQTVNSELYYVDGTYDALGNNGTCYNLDLLDCSDVNNVPDSIISALYYSSDHLPVVCTLRSDRVLGASVDENFDFTMYPNPSDNLVTIHSPKQIKDVTLLSSTGQVLLTKNLKTPVESTDFNIDHLADGVYFVRVTSSNNTVIIKQLIK